MTRMSPAKLAAKNKRTPGADAATSLRTEGDQPNTTKEAVVPNHSPAIVDVLTRVDAKSVRDSVNAEHLDLIRMRDGSTPTDAELHLILRATSEDLRAAADALRAEADREYARQQKREDLVRLIEFYAEPMETTEAFLPRMSAADRARFYELTEYFK